MMISSETIDLNEQQDPDTRTQINILTARVNMKQSYKTIYINSIRTL